MTDHPIIPITNRDFNRQNLNNTKSASATTPTFSLPHQHMTSVLNEATTLSPEAMKAYVEHLASLIAQLEIREKEKETSNTDLKERIEEKEEIKENVIFKYLK